jgi:hypothetical protein
MPIIRNTTDKDIKDVEYICRMTAGPGSIADERIGNIIAKTYATYYARTEQEVSFVLDDGGKAVGYILCAPDFKRKSRNCSKLILKADFLRGSFRLHIFRSRTNIPRICILIYSMAIAEAETVQQW